jgi:hypothetical protein
MEKTKQIKPREQRRNKKQKQTLIASQTIKCSMIARKEKHRQQSTLRKGN